MSDLIFLFGVVAAFCFIAWFQVERFVVRRRGAYQLVETLRNELRSPRGSHDGVVCMRRYKLRGLSREMIAEVANQEGYEISGFGFHGGIFYHFHFTPISI
ncbi:hypothetical protein [Halopolyspora algeriensis]|uniref:hypothetical protein n=1 Tax=Halopolyspora algeriensis TaxID=1500506 RepID=UPI00114D5C12|nr:hypothetical protein [Halopolyspora algeriensis]